MDKPGIAVPASVEYGVASGGITALLADRNICAPGMVVVKMGNGFGTACMAATINKV